MWIWCARRTAIENSLQRVARVFALQIAVAVPAICGSGRGKYIMSDDENSNSSQSTLNQRPYDRAFEENHEQRPA